MHEPASISGTPAPDTDVPVGDGLADLRRDEGKKPGVVGPENVGRPTDAAEHRRYLEQIWPEAALYHQPKE